MRNLKTCSTSLEKTVKNIVARGQRKVYLRELLSEAKVSIEDAEDFLIPLLGEGTIEGSLELHCPVCGADLGSFRRYTDIPNETECYACGNIANRSDDYLEVVLEVKGGFFRCERKVPAMP